LEQTKVTDGQSGFLAPVYQFLKRCFGHIAEFFR
jgi:hypothetical protein